MLPGEDGRTGSEVQEEAFPPRHFHVAFSFLLKPAMMFANHSAAVLTLRPFVFMPRQSFLPNIMSSSKGPVLLASVVAAHVSAQGYCSVITLADHL